eukprot:1196180-Prorocentrum_minimum.AAC.1
MFSCSPRPRRLRRPRVLYRSLSSQDETRFLLWNVSALAIQLLSFEVRTWPVHKRLSRRKRVRDVGCGMWDVGSALAGALCVPFADTRAPP